MSGSIGKSFDINDLNRRISAKDRLVMAETILAWADLDTSISRLILLVFGIQDDAGSILIGNMDMKTKVEKIKAFNEHHGKVRHAAAFTRLSNAMKVMVECRNMVAHRKCIGKLKSDKTRLVFISAKHVKKAPGQFEMSAIDHTEFVASAKFARDAAATVHKMIIAIEDSANDAQNGGP